LVVEQKWIDEIRSSLPELPDTKRERFVSEYGLPESDADLLVSEKKVAEFFEEAVQQGGNPKTICSWILTGIFGYLNQHGKDFSELPIKPIHLTNLSKLVETAVVSGTMAKSTILFEILTTGNPPEDIIKEKGLVQISDSSELEKTVDDVIAKHIKEVERFKAGDEKLIGFFVGQVMKLTKGKANPQMVNELLKNKLSS
jgi:aspartyl-tRNA(Asn)/glutamyl-tRNA(Gln) amidotransferase subunit B